LLAVRILGSYEPALQRKIEEYATNAKLENLDIKGTKIKEIGWEKYFEQM
jgi:phosphoribosylaminoimidazole carboxylase